ncbi:MAG: STAS domain-containing protein [Verrucomicrobiota bacterium]
MPEQMIMLPPKLRRAEVTALHQQLLEAAADTPVTLDASAVEEMSTPAVALVLSAQQTFAASEGSLKISGAGVPFTDAFSDLGCFSEMMKLEFV